jgi:DNA-binding IscR family transcriptional regulator
MLGRAADKISAGDILRAVNEVLEPVFCVDADPGVVCTRTDFCVTHLLWQRLGHHIMDLLESVTLADLCQQSTRLAESEPRRAGCVEEATDDLKIPRSGQFGDCALVDGAGI